MLDPSSNDFDLPARRGLTGRDGVRRRRQGCRRKARDASAGLNRRGTPQIKRVSLQKRLLVACLLVSLATAGATGPGQPQGTQFVRVKPIVWELAQNDAGNASQSANPVTGQVPGGSESTGRVQRRPSPEPRAGQAKAQGADGAATIELAQAPTGATGEVEAAAEPEAIPAVEGKEKLWPPRELLLGPDAGEKAPPSGGAVKSGMAKAASGATEASGEAASGDEARRKFAASAAGAGASGMASADATSEVGIRVSPTQRSDASTELPTWDDGFYPTQEETRLMPPDLRRRGTRGGVGGYVPFEPGPIVYPDRDTSFEPVYKDYFAPINSTVGLLARDQQVVWYPGGDEANAIQINPEFGPLTQRFDPENATFKAGPFFLDVLSTGAGVLYSDYSGPREFAPGEEPGWLGFVDTDLRAVLRITDTLYLAASARVVLVPGANDPIGFRFGFGTGPKVRLVYERQIGDWDLLAYNEFRGGFGSLYGSTDSVERAGRYSFGFGPGSSNDFLDDSSIRWSNRIGVQAARSLGEDWRLRLGAQHADYWRTWSFRGHSHREQISAGVFAQGNNIPFSPYLRYIGSSPDYFDSMIHRVYAGGSGRLTSNVTFVGRVGYLWSTGQEPARSQPAWRAGVTHQISERLRHGLSGGQDYVEDDLTGDTAITDFIRYFISCRISDQLSGGAFAQWSREDRLTVPISEGERRLYGLFLNYNPFVNTRIGIGANFEERDLAGSGITRERELYYAFLRQGIYDNMSAFARFQYEVDTFFEEQLYVFGFRYNY